MIAVVGLLSAVLPAAQTTAIGRSEPDGGPGFLPRE